MMSRIPGVLGAICALLLLALLPAQASETQAVAAPEADGVEVGNADEQPIDTPPADAQPMAETEPTNDLMQAEDESGSESPDYASEAVETPSKPSHAVVLGEVGYDDQGREGRIHIVVPGDTLWDISDAYLGTPWVWPSIWTDNRDIQNPHLILPKDRIWISRHEMRRVTAEEAERLLAGEPATDVPAAVEDGVEGDPLPRTYRVSYAESHGFVTSQELESSASIVESVAPRVMMVQPDEVYIGLGESDVAVGDQFTIFRTDAKIYDPDTNRLLGYHVNVLGWAEVTKPAAETSIVQIRQSNSEIEAGDRIMPREPAVIDVELTGSPEGVDGQIAFLPHGRGMMAMTEFVYLNRGSLDGLAVGNELAVYRPGWRAREEARNERVAIPDRPIADLLVVRTRDDTSVALIRQSETELELGDHFRGASEFAPAVSASPASPASME